MPNCDWGRPCDCKECRTVYKNIDCPNCGFTNVVAIVRETVGYVTDRKGISSYEFAISNEPVKDLLCFKCKHLIEKVGYYSEIAQHANKQNLFRENAIK